MLAQYILRKNSMPSPLKVDEKTRMLRYGKGMQTNAVTEHIFFPFSLFFVLIHSNPSKLFAPDLAVMA